MLLPSPKFTEWLAVERDAQAAERELHAEMFKAATGAASPDLTDIALTAQAKRAKAQVLFGEAMQELKTLAESHFPGRIHTWLMATDAKPTWHH